jgi:acetyltransferase-like isoleucine patch superfamily enzyme
MKNFLSKLYKLYLLKNTIFHTLLGRRIKISTKIMNGVYISREAIIGHNSIIGRHSRIYGRVIIGDNVEIENNVILHGDIKIGNNSKLEHDVIINKCVKGKIFIGNNVVLQHGSMLDGNINIGDDSTVGNYTTIGTFPEAKFKIGKDVFINQLSVLGACESVEIKDHCIFGAFVQITDSEHDYSNLEILIKHAPIKTKPVCVEENVWLSSGVLVLKGVTIGSGSVIGAKSVVSKNIPKNSVALGSPASVVWKRQ